MDNFSVVGTNGQMLNSGVPQQAIVGGMTQEELNALAAMAQQKAAMMSQTPVNAVAPVGVASTESVSNDTRTLGAKLREITAKSKNSVEIKQFYSILEGAAQKGENKVKFLDLRQHLNSLIIDGSIWNWMQAQELKASGSVTATGAYEYIISWE